MAITERVEKIRQNYVNTKPHIYYERAWAWTKSFQVAAGAPPSSFILRNGSRMAME